jgi:polyhydroxyalkanoate synthesis regulator phasin
MTDRDKSAVAAPAAPAPAVGATVPPAIPPKRSPGHRGADVKDTVAEMAAKAHEISLEAGSKMAAAMKDVVGAAAGLTGFVLESARDLLQYMVRRGQMTQEEADKLMREVEASHAKRKPFTAPASAAPKPSAKVDAGHEAPRHHTPVPARHPTPPHTVKHAAPPPVKHAPAKKPAAKKTTMKPAAKKHPVKSSTKSKPKASGKTAKRR